MADGTIKIDGNDVLWLEDHVKLTTEAFVKMKRLADKKHKLEDRLEGSAEKAIDGHSVAIRLNFFKAGGEPEQGGVIMLSYVPGKYRQGGYDCFNTIIAAWMKDDYNEMDDLHIQVSDTNSSGPDIVRRFLSDDKTIRFLIHPGTDEINEKVKSDLRSASTEYRRRAITKMLEIVRTFTE